MGKLHEWQKLERTQRRYAATSFVLTEIQQDHPELTQSIQVIRTHIAKKMEQNEKRILELYGKHGEGLIEH